LGRTDEVAKHLVTAGSSARGAVFHDTAVRAR